MKLKGILAKKKRPTATTEEASLCLYEIKTCYLMEMDYNLDEFLKGNTTFASLDAEARSVILPKFSQTELNRNDVLFYQGDPSSSVYLLIQGKLSAELTMGTGERRIVGHIEPGETVGELGALSNEPRALTIKALKDSVLLKLATEDFIEICHRYPTVMFAILHPIMRRTSGLIQMLSVEKRNKHIVIVPANKQISLAEFSEQLLLYADKYESTLFVSDYQPAFKDKNIEAAVVKEKIQRLAQDRKSTNRIIYILSSFDTPLARIGFKRAEMIYIAATVAAEPKLDIHILDKIESKYVHLQTVPNLILIHPADAITPMHTDKWLKTTDFGLYHHVRLDAAKDFQRLLRFMRGKAVGLVLGGGGTRGWAHLGAIKAIREAKIPIDMIGGTSVGALVAGFYALNQSYEDAYDKFKQIVIASSHSISWRQLTLPVISLFDAKKYTLAQQEIFGKTAIEDLWLPYFCITSNLANNSEEVHRSGLLWEKIRASTALPGIMPPMLINGEIHLDGGLLNNLPVDVMRQFTGQKGKVIAVDLNNNVSDKTKYKFPPIMTFKEALFAKLGYTNYKFPRFVDTFLRGIFLGSMLRANQNAMSANVFVSLDLTAFSALHSNPEEGDKLVQIGYEETKKLIIENKRKS